MNTNQPPDTGLRLAERSKRAVCYIRTASARTSDVRQGTERQRKACHRKALSLDAKVLEEYVDAGVSGNRSDRPGLARLFDFASKNHVDYVIVENRDRLARNPRLATELARQISQTGAEVVECENRPAETAIAEVLLAR